MNNYNNEILLFFKQECKASVFGFNGFYNVSKNLFFDSDDKCIVEYELNIQVKSYGIESILINVKKILIDINWKLESTKISKENLDFLLITGAEIKQNIIVGTIGIDSERDNFTISSLAFFSNDGSFKFELVEIDIENKIIEVY